MSKTTSSGEMAYYWDMDLLLLILLVLLVLFILGGFFVSHFVWIAIIVLVAIFLLFGRSRL